MAEKSEFAAKEIRSKLSQVDRGAVVKPAAPVKPVSPATSGSAKNVSAKATSEAKTTSVKPGAVTKSQEPTRTGSKKPVGSATNSDVQRMMGPFLIEKKLGAGGMGVVYKATYIKNGASVALKVLPLSLSSNTQLVARFEREMKILKKLQHPRIVKFYGGGEHEEQSYYAMEFIDGTSLEAVLKDKGRLPWQEVIEYGVQICEALQHAHEHGIVHRDLKPANLFIGKDGKLKLGDFGIARDTDATALTASGSTCGTSSYMAPEQITGKQPISAKTDLYALGCLLFEMLTGHVPFVGTTQMELLLKHINEVPPKIRVEVLDCPTFLEQVVLQLLEKQPDKRPYDALMTQVALEEVIERVTAKTSMSQQLVTGTGQTAIGLTNITDPEELKKLLAKKKKKKKATGPIWERSWFLAASLVVLIGGVTWALWPLSEEKLFAKATPLMQSDDPGQWQDAYQMYLEPLLRRFPDGKHAAEALEFRDKVEMHRAERGIETRLRLGQNPKSEPERLYLQARNFEKFGDMLTAKEQYRSLIELLKDRDQDRSYLNLAKRQLGALESKVGESQDRKQIVNAALKKARKLYFADVKSAAKETWRSIIELYANKPEFSVEIAEAQAGRDDKLSEFLEKQAAERAEDGEPANP